MFNNLCTNIFVEICIDFCLYMLSIIVIVIENLRSCVVCCTFSDHMYMLSIIVIVIENLNRKKTVSAVQTHKKIGNWNRPRKLQLVHLYFKPFI